MTLDYVIVSIKLCPEVGNDEFIIVCNFGMSDLKVMEGRDLRALPSHRKQKKLDLNWVKVSATLKIAVFPYLRFQRFQIGMFESFLLKKKSEENIISVERYRG